MKVWFGATSAKFNKYKKYYYSIRICLKQNGCEVLFDWLEDAEDEIKNKKVKEILKKFLKMF